MTNPKIKSPEEMTPNEWLTTIREKYGLMRKYDFPDSWLNDLLDHLPVSDREAARKVWIGRRSQTASQVQDEMMELYLHQIMPILLPEEKKIVESTFFGILPTYRVGAYTGFTPKGDRIAIFHHALVYTLAYWSHWYLMIKEEGSGYFQKSDKIIETLYYILSYWMGYEPKGRLPDIYPKTEDSWNLDSCLVLSAISFIIGHELGHIISGHTKYSSIREVNHEMEFKADRIGLSIAIRHSLVKSVAIEGDTYHTKFMLFGPLFALAVISLFGDSSSNTHPSPSLRREKLMSVYRLELQDLLTNGFDSFLENMDNDLFEVLDKNSKRLYDIFKNWNEIINDMKRYIRKPETPWLQSEFVNFRS